MTTQEKLQIITQQIRKDIPRLMELSKGCIIKSNDVGTEYKIVGTLGKLCFIFNGVRVDDIHISNILKHFKIIGHEPMLNDVLEWFEKMRQLPEDTFFQDLFFQTNNGKYLEIYGDGGLIEKWDLSRPYLKDQSEELINFLYNLTNK